MKNKNYSARRQPKDCWNARLLQNAEYSSKWEFPLFPCTQAVPTTLKSFRYVNPNTEDSNWIHFYGFDEYIENVWKKPELWANNLKRFAGVISPDLSIYQDMPLAQQISNIYRNRVLAHWFTQQGIPVIPNIRYSDQRSYDFAFEGIEKNATVCVSTSGLLANNEDREVFCSGFDAMMETLTPKTVLIYGSAPNHICERCNDKHIRLIQYDTDTQNAHQRSDW